MELYEVIPFSVKKREAVLKEFYALRKERANFSFSFNPGDKQQSDRFEVVNARMSELADEYRAGVPVVTVSRCPFCNKELNYRIDNLGIDGLWWDYDRPERPQFIIDDPHFIGLTGAVKVSLPVNDVPILVMPGPDIPFVVPRIFQEMNATAVISQIPIGNNIGYAVAYFASPLPPPDIARVNEWGIDFYRYLNFEGKEVAGKAEMDLFQYDYDLPTWLMTSKLTWIEPNDSRLIVHKGFSICPFVNMTGKKEVQIIQFGDYGTVDFN